MQEITMMNESPQTHETHELKTYKRRYLVCFAFAFNSIVNAMIWITFAPIQSKSATFFDVSQGAINLYSMTFMICYVPGSIVCALMFKKYYLRKSFIFSSGGQLLGTILRFIATLDCIRLHSSATYLSYSMVLIGQTLAALCQPFYTNSPARIPAEWFSKDGRDVATALLSIINPLGIGLGSFIPTLFVTTDGNHWYGFQGIVLLQMMLCVVGFILTLIFFYDKPPTSPSVSQKLKQSQIQTSLRYDAKQILTNKHFLFLVVGFGIGLGLFNALTTLINQYTACYGYTTDDAGNFGGLLVAGGLVGAVVAGVFMEIFHEYRLILKSFTFLAIVMLGMLLWQLSPHNLVPVMVLFGGFGFMAIPIVAVTFEAAAECTYPVNEELSSALLMTSGSVFGIAFILVWGAYLPDDGTRYDTQWNFSTYFLITSGCVMLLFMMLFGGKYKRWNAEHQFAQYIEDLNDDDSEVDSEWMEKQIKKNGNINNKPNGYEDIETFES
eukprot:37880_1